MTSLMVPFLWKLKPSHPLRDFDDHDCVIGTNLEKKASQLFDNLLILVA